MPGLTRSQAMQGRAVFISKRQQKQEVTDSVQIES